VDIIILVTIDIMAREGIDTSDNWILFLCISDMSIFAVMYF
jgi:hypothetical protein